jgi:hypothetical protein
MLTTLPARCSMWIASPRTGTLKSIDFVDVVRKHPNVIEANANFKVGDRVKGVDKSIPDVVGVFMMKMAADDLRKNCEEAERLRDSLVFDIEPDTEPPLRRPSRRRYVFPQHVLALSCTLTQIVHC